MSKSSVPGQAGVWRLISHVRDITVHCGDVVERKWHSRSLNWLLLQGIYIYDPCMSLPELRTLSSHADRMDLSILFYHWNDTEIDTLNAVCGILS